MYSSTALYRTAITGTLEIIINNDHSGRMKHHSIQHRGSVCRKLNKHIILCMVIKVTLLLYLYEYSASISALPAITNNHVFLIATVNLSSSEYI